jgi:Zn-dependent alcohol dehydrogenase
VKTRAAVMWEVGKPWDVVELELDPPKAGEVLVKFAASGMCRSDDHLRTGDLPSRYPVVGGHEGAGVVQQVGEGVYDIAEGDHIVCSFLPTCGKCRWCSTGHQNLCDMGATLAEGHLPDGTFRFHSGEQDLGAMCMLGTFSEYAVLSRNSVVKIDDDIPLDKAALVGCGVPTGWGSAVYTADVGPGDTPVRGRSSPSTRSSSSGPRRSSSARRTPSPPERRRSRRPPSSPRAWARTPPSSRSTS